MKELLAGPKIETPDSFVKKNFHDMKGNACNCPHCTAEFERQAELHILTAPVKESGHMTKEQLMEDVREMQAQQRKTILQEKVVFKRKR